MYRKILVPMALDHGISHQTLAVARTLSHPGAQIIALHVHEASQGSVGAYIDKETVQAGYDYVQSILNEKVAGLDEVTPVMVTGHSARAIIDYAGKNDIDCIVVGSHKPGLSDYFLGSTAARVVRHANCAVHVHRNT